MNEGEPVSRHGPDASSIVFPDLATGAGFHLRPQDP